MVYAGNIKNEYWHYEIMVCKNPSYACWDRCSLPCHLLHLPLHHLQDKHATSNTIFYLAKLNLGLFQNSFTFWYFTRHDLHKRKSNSDT